VRVRDYDVVLSSLGTATLDKSLQVLRPGGKLISISGPPDPVFAKDQGLNWMLKLGIRVLSYKIRQKAKRRGVSYSFLFMRANGGQLHEITSLIDAGIIRPVVDRVFPFESTVQALAYVETRPRKRQGRCQGELDVWGGSEADRRPFATNTCWKALCRV
jgi:NADPH:quinone reductase-like Zn-dependent oxidoreductase